MIRFFSFILSVVTALAALPAQAGYSVFTSVFDGAAALLTDRASFLEELDDSAVSQFDENSGYVKNMLLVFFEEESGLSARLRALRSIGGVAVGSLREIGLCVVRTNGLNYEKLSALAEKAQSLDSVALATVCPASRCEPQYIPDDPFSNDPIYPATWDVSNPGGTNWWVEAIEANGAWGYNDYFDKINLGVVDGGFDTDHPELDGRIVFPNARSERRNRPESHGTGVAGIIAAKGDNGIGISGICQNAELICSDWYPEGDQLWNPEVQILFGFVEVAKAGAKVINFSLGKSKSISEDYSASSDIVKWFDGVFYSYTMGLLLRHGYDFVVVQAAGNGNEAQYPVDAVNSGEFCAISENTAFLPFAGISVKTITDRIIVVGSSKQKHNGVYVQADYSNVGDRVDICAPGNNVFSCIDGGYGQASGTSFAAPVVTGVAGLVWSVNSSLSGAQVKEIVCRSTVGEVEPTEGRFFPELTYKSYGMVNAKAAVEAALATKYTVSQVELTVDGSRNDSVTFTGEAGEFTFETDNDGKLSCVLEPGSYTVSYGNFTRQLEVTQGTCSFEL